MPRRVPLKSSDSAGTRKMTSFFASSVMRNSSVGDGGKHAHTFEVYYARVVIFSSCFTIDCNMM